RSIDTLIADNRLRYQLYRAGLASVRGIRLVDHAAGERSNYQYVVAAISPQEFGMTRDAMVAKLHGEGVMARRYLDPGVHAIPPFDGKQWVLPVTDALCQTLIQLPTGQAMTEHDVARVCAVIRDAVAD